MTVPMIDDGAIRQLALTTAEVREAVREAFLQRADGRASLVPKVGIYPPTGGLFHAMPAAIEGLAVVKWLVEGGRPQPGLARLQATILATDPLSGRLLAVLDGAWLTALRTAAVTALALQSCPPPNPRSIAFVGAGVQAHVHADALCGLLPLRRARILSRTQASADLLMDKLLRLGLEVEVTQDPRAVAEGADVLVTAVPFVQRVQPFLDAGWLPADCFAAAVDLGRSWVASSYPAFDRVLTDDRDHTAAFLKGGLTDSPGAVTDDLPALLSRAGGAAGPVQGRTLLFAPGVAIADAAVAKVVLRRVGILD